MVVRTRLSAWQHVRPPAVEVLAPPSYSGFCPHLWLPALYGVVHLQHVWHPAKPSALGRRRLGHVGRHRACLLDDYRDDDRRRYHPLVHLRASDLVLLLSDGNHLALGGSEESAAAVVVHQYPCGKHLPDEVHELCPRLPDAAQTLRVTRR